MLEQIKERVKALDGLETTDWHNKLHKLIVFDRRGVKIAECRLNNPAPTGYEIADFIANARQDIPYLIELLEKLELKTSQLEGELAKGEDHYRKRFLEMAARADIAEDNLATEREKNAELMKYMSDCTPLQSDDFTRGESYGAGCCARLINDVLDGKTDGVMCEPIGPARQRLIDYITTERRRVEALAGLVNRTLTAIASTMPSTSKTITKQLARIMEDGNSHNAQGDEA